MTRSGEGEGGGGQVHDIAHANWLAAAHRDAGAWDGEAGVAESDEIKAESKRMLNEAVE